MRKTAGLKIGEREANTPHDGQRNSETKGTYAVLTSQEWIETPREEAAPSLIFGEEREFHGCEKRTKSVANEVRNILQSGERRDLF